MPLDRRLYFLLHRAHHGVRRHASTATLEHLGVTPSQLSALHYIAAHDGCTMTDVANVLDLNKSGVSGLVQRMERAGLLRREANPVDGRGSLLFMTAKAHDVRARAVPLLRRLNAELTRGFDATEIDIVLRFLNSIVDRYATDASGEETER
jgi:DNA-binding MarR family transcriptional regulator